MSFSERGKLTFAVVLLLIAAVGWWATHRGGHEPVFVWMYDLGDGKLIAHPIDQLPPITAPSGKQGVRAIVTTCGACSEKELTVHYLLKYTDAAREALNNPAPRESAGPNNTAQWDQFQVIDQGTLVAFTPENKGDEPEWITRTAAVELQLHREYKKRCPGVKYRECLP